MSAARDENAQHTSVRRLLRGIRPRAGAADGPSRSDAAYRVYAGILLVLIVIAPAVRAAILWAVGALPESGATPIPLLAAALALITAALVLSAAQTGPARADLPRLDLLFTAPLPRSRLLAGSVVRGFTLGVAVALLAAFVIGAAHWMRGELEPGLALALVAGAAGTGLLAVFGMLIGQLGRRVRAAVAAALTLAALAQLGFGLGNGFGSAPSGFGSAPSGFGSAPAALGFALTLLGVGLAAAGCAPGVVRRLRWEGLREQAVRWDTVSALAITGDSRAAAARLGAPVRVGRRWRWRPSGRVIVSRDLLGIARTPARTLASAAVLLVCGAVLEWAILAGSAAFPSGPQPAFAIGAAVGVAVQAGIAPLCRGLRSAAEGAGAAPLLPLSPGALLRRHLVVPGALSAALLACGMLLAVLLTMTGSVDPGGAGVELGEVITACLAAVAFALAGLALRLLAALKGPLPQRLLAPIPTEVGDLAGMSVFLWTFDGPILAVLVGGAIGMLWIPGAGAVPAAPLGALVPAVGTLAVLAVLALWARSRLAAARG